MQNLRPITIAVDALGGDNAPEVVCAGVRAFLQDANSQVNIILTGPAEVVNPLAAEFPKRIEAVATTEFIAMDEHPATAIKQKKDSSIVVACRLVEQGRADAFFSAGSTGACMAAATLIIGRIKGIARPAIVAVLPAPKKPVVLLDVGANADVKPDYLLQFAQMGRAYAMAALNVAQPRIGLLNVGSEKTKGSMFAQEIHTLLAENLEGFAGNAEGDDLFTGAFDCIVTDGFTGNIVLKTIEGTASSLLSQIKTALTSSLVAKMGALLVKGKFATVKETLSADKYGGAPLLGLKNIVMIGHGSSNAKAIANGIRASADAVRAELPALITQAVADKTANSKTPDTSKTSSANNTASPQEQS
ncbi:MAG: phosphate acyltransferase PlsX [Coriobacteriales bacterium]|jgi:glycerol-3-phosphate acyltransferase PlsX|nr:phosphate acyltransferase PlsX [Coriobacteriales bacterium]